MSASPLLDLIQIVRLLEAGPRLLEAEVGALSPTLQAWHPAPGEWCANEAIGHMLEAERRGFYGRIRTILAEDHPVQESWDQEAIARDRRDCKRDSMVLVHELAALRAEGVQLVRSLQPEDLQRSCDHAKVGTLTVDEILHEWVHHDRNHIKQIMANVQSMVWPAMGHAQRFSRP